MRCQPPIICRVSLSLLCFFTYEKNRKTKQKRPFDSFGETNSHFKYALLCSWGILSNTNFIDKRNPPFCHTFQKRIRTFFMRRRTPAGTGLLSCAAKLKTPQILRRSPAPVVCSLRLYLSAAQPYRSSCPSSSQPAPLQQRR